MGGLTGLSEDWTRLLRTEHISSPSVQLVSHCDMNQRLLCEEKDRYRGLINQDPIASITTALSPSGIVAWMGSAWASHAADSDRVCVRTTLGATGQNTRHTQVPIYSRFRTTQNVKLGQNAHTLRICCVLASQLCPRTRRTYVICWSKWTLAEGRDPRSKLLHEHSVFVSSLQTAPKKAA